MAYTTPTAAEFKEIFPAFAATADATVDYWIGRAERVVDDSWMEDDRTHATMLLTAHYLTEQGQGTGAEAEAAAAGASGFKTMRSGSLTLERFADGMAKGLYAGTSYGRQFALLLQANRGGPRVTSTGTYPVYPAQSPIW